MLQNQTGNKLLFICGFPGGGTDLTKTILNAHPDIYINGEMPFLQKIVDLGYDRHTRFTRIGEITAFQAALKKLDPWENLENIDHDFSQELTAKNELDLEEVLRVCFSKYSPRIWGNKTPQNTEKIEPLADLFPDAYFLIITRDVRDICLSWRNKWGRNEIWCAVKWAQRMKKGWCITQSLPPEQYLYVRFEEVLSATEECCRKVCDFLDIPFARQMLEHHRYTTNTIDGKINYGQKIRSENKDKWKSSLSPRTAKRIEEIAFETMDLLGYEAAFAAQPKAISPWENLYGLGHDLGAFLLVGNRASQQNTLGQKLGSLVFEIKKRWLKLT